jgi:branched-chain amino acid transport system permease protein
MVELLLEQVVNGIVAGSVYALVAAGMTMIFGVLRAINFAHGEYYMLGTFSAWWVITRLDMPYVASILLAVAITMAIAAVIGRLVMQRLVTTPFQSGVLATLGLSLILQNAVILSFGGTYKIFPGGWLEPVEFLDISLAQQRIVIVAATIAVFAALEFVVRRTRMGKCIRAVSQNTDCSGGMGEAITLKTFAVIVMGGMGNVRGTLFAGWILGIAESFVAGYVGLQYRDAVGFVILIAMLMFRPQGFFSVQARF